MNVSKIHNLHMNVSYNYSHIHRYIENKLNKTRFKFNRHTISLNRFNRYDMSIQILTNNLECVLNSPPRLITKQKLMKIFRDDKKQMSELTDTFSTTVNELIDLYSKLDSSEIIPFIGKTYSDIKNSLNSRKTGTLYFLGMLEWFHVDLIKSIITDECFVIGEIVNIELELIETSELNETIKNYNSHAIVFLISPDIIGLFDPDFSTDEKHTNKLFPNVQHVNFIETSIQEITDDNYCIFHCFNFILEFSDFVRSANSNSSLLQTITDFSALLNIKRKTITFDSVHKMILNLDQIATKC